MHQKRRTIYQALQKNSHWLVLAYAAGAAWLTYFKSFLGELPDVLIFYLGLPVLIIVSLKGSLAGHGLALGNWKQGLLWTSGFVALSIATTWFAVHTMPDIRRYYVGEVFGPALIWSTVVYMAA